MNNMHRFFAEEIDSASGTVRLTGSNARHAAQVLRLTVQALRVQTVRVLPPLGERAFPGKSR